MQPETSQERITEDRRQQKTEETNLPVQNQEEIEIHK